MSRVLVAGVYPPVPLPAARMAMTWVGELSRHDDHVEVVSPRLSAAHFSAPLSGRGAGRALARLAKARRADVVVLCLSPGVPFDPESGRLGTWRTGRALRRAARRLPRLQIVVAGDPGVPPHTLAFLWAYVEAVWVGGEDQARLAVEGLGAPAGLVRQDEALAQPQASGPASFFDTESLATLTVSGPPEFTSRFDRLAATWRAEVVARLVHRARLRAGRMVRRVLGMEANQPLRRRP